MKEPSRDAAMRQFSRFMPVEEAEAVLQFLDEAAAGNSPVASTPIAVLGCPAIDEWAVEHAGDFRCGQHAGLLNPASPRPPGRTPG